MNVGPLLLSRGSDQADLFGDFEEAVAQFGRFSIVQLNDQSSAAIDWQAQDQAPALFNDFHWPITSAWLHSSH